MSSRGRRRGRCGWRCCWTRRRGHPPEPRVIAAGFRSAVGVLARSAPVLLVIDDVQWLDPPSQAAVGFAVRRLAGEPVGLLCAQRTSAR